MDCSENRFSRPKTMPGTSKSSHIISKRQAATCRAIHESDGFSPSIRIVQIFAPKIVKTDPANFRALVQKLTGRHSDRSYTKPVQNRRVSSEKHDTVDFNPVQAQSAMDHSHASSVVDGNFFSKQPAQNEFVWHQDQRVAEFVWHQDQRVGDPHAEIKTDSLEKGGVKVCDNFSGFYGGFEEDFFGNLMESGSMVPELPIINPHSGKQNDYHTGIFSP